jgi:hypothetical protein
MERIDQAEAEDLLDMLGQRIVRFYDDAVEAANSKNPLLARDWQQLLDQQPDASTKQNKVIQNALETLLHDFLFYLQEQREFRIQALTKSGEWVNIDEYSDGIHGDLFGWLKQKSKYGCVTIEFLEIRSSSEDRRKGKN